MRLSSGAMGAEPSGQRRQASPACGCRSCRTLSGEVCIGTMLELRVTRSETMFPGELKEIVELCDIAYGEDLTGLFATCGPSTHITGLLGSNPVTHAMWVTRHLETARTAVLQTAYVEAVATHPEYRHRGFASQVLRQLVATIPPSYQLAALCPAEHALYERLGWRFWRGPLSIRMPLGEMEPTPEERIMILELPRAPPIDLDAPLSAEWRAGEVW